MALRIRSAVALNDTHHTPMISPGGGASTADGRIHGRAVFVADENYVVDEDDRFITLESTDGLSHTIDFTGVVACVDGQLVDVAMTTDAAGAGNFTLVGVNTSQTFTAVGDHALVKWSVAAGAWVVVVPTSAGSTTDSTAFCSTSVNFTTDLDNFLGFSAGAASSSLAHTIGPVSILGIAIDKYGSAPGRVTGLILQTPDGSDAVTVNVFVDVSTGGAAFVRTTVATAIILLGGAITVVPLDPFVSFILADRFRVGLVNSGGGVLTTISGELQLTYP